MTSPSGPRGPYKDRLLLFSRYLQQLVMESLGKQFDLQGRRVDQGLATFGSGLGTELRHRVGVSPAS